MKTCCFKLLEIKWNCTRFWLAREWVENLSGADWHRGFFPPWFRLTVTKSNWSIGITFRMNVSRINFRSINKNLLGHNRILMNSRKSKRNSETKKECAEKNDIFLITAENDTEHDEHTRWNQYCLLIRLILTFQQLKLMNILTRYSAKMNTQTIHILQLFIQTEHQCSNFYFFWLVDFISSSFLFHLAFLYLWCLFSAKNSTYFFLVFSNFIVFNALSRKLVLSVATLNAYWDRQNKAKHTLNFSSNITRKKETSLNLALIVQFELVFGSKFRAEANRFVIWCSISQLIIESHEQTNSIDTSALIHHKQHSGKKTTDDG